MSGLCTIGEISGQGVVAADSGCWLDLKDRVQFVECLFEGRRGSPWAVRAYQRASLNSTALRKVHCDGRDVGKTTEIEAVACWAVLSCPDSEMLIATQTENQLFPLMNRIARRLEEMPAFVPKVVEKTARSTRS